MIDPIATQTSQVKNNLITQYQGKHYKYDAQGNVIETMQSGQTLKLTWDNLNRLIQSDHNGQITSYGYDVFGRRLFKKNTTEDSLTLFGWDGDLMIWESYKTNSNQANKENYTKHYVYEPNSFVPLLQTGYTRFIELIETPDYRQFQDVPYSIYKDPVWKTDTQKNKAELERVAFYHCDQVGTPQTLSNELGECIWEIKQDTWGTALEIKATEQDNPFGDSNIRFQGQYYDKETGLHYNRYRYYEPYSARYMSKDQIGLNGGFNNSAYVSDPNQWIDPMGLKDDAAMIARYTGKRSTQKDFADLATTWGDWADYGSVACTIPSPCTPAVPVLKTAGTGLGALGNILDDSKPWHQRVLGIFLPAKVGGKAEEVVTNPAIHKAASSAYGVAVDKLTGQVIDVTYEKYGSNQDKKQYSPVVNYQIPLVVIPKDPYDFSPLSR